MGDRMARTPAAKRTTIAQTAAARKAAAHRPAAKPVKRTFDALPDTVDFRDKLYVPTLVEVRPASNLAGYKSAKVPVLDQGSDGACTGFALATVVNYLLRMGHYGARTQQASPQMLYTMAKRYDEWPGETYEGSSARGAMKGWHKHGVAADSLWGKHTDLTEKLAADALKRPLGAYFRVNHKDLVAMHSAITETGILYATATVHQGWADVKRGDTTIAYSAKKLGGHAFAIVGYDREGFWIQNSWGRGWGSSGLARLSYVDWLENGTDIWVARLGAPINLTQPLAAARMRASAPRSYESYVYASLRPHVVTAGNDGALLDTGSYALTPEGVRSIVRDQLPRTVKSWPKKRVMLYAHGGLVSQDSALQYAANYREACLKAQVYPIAFIWRSDFWTTIGDILQDAVSTRKTEGFLDATKDFMLDRLDDTLEPVARALGGKALWDEMKENAELCASDKAGPERKDEGAARLVARHLVAAYRAKEIDEIHLVGHSAGSILLAPLAQYLADNKVPVSSLSLWAPACTLELFNSVYAPLIASNAIQAFDLYTLDDATEQDDDCANIYHKSLLYFVSNAFEDKPHIPRLGPNGKPTKGTPILGMARDAGTIPAAFWTPAKRQWIVAPNSDQSHARHHGDFDNDGKTLLSTLHRMTGGAKATSQTMVLKSPLARAARVRAGVNAALFTP